jgi:hypothetical protein
MLRPTAHQLACTGFITEFNNAVQVLPEGSVLISSSPGCACTISAPLRPEYSFIGEYEPSPIMLSSKDSANNESINNFTSINTPRDNLQGVYHSTPKHAQKSKVLPFINTLTESSEPAQAASSSTTPKADLVKLKPLVKQESVENPYRLSTVHRCNIVATFAVKPSPIMTLPNPKPLPTIPATHSNIISNLPYCMPVCGTNNAPKFYGQPSQLCAFLEEFETQADHANLQGGDHIKYVLWYLNPEDRELWSGIPEAQSSDYNAFIDIVKEMYPGWEGTCCYTITDLQGIM